MFSDNHQLISDLSEEYAKNMLKHKNGNPFLKADIAAAYIIGAEETLQRACNAIRHSVKAGGITQRQGSTLLRAIERIESMNHEQTAPKEY